MPDNASMREFSPTSPPVLPGMPGLTAPAPERPGWQQVQPAAVPQTLEEILHKLHFETVNTRQPDGRINGGTDRNGNPIYYFVSPYAERFWDNVEPGVVPLVRALRSKRYLTYSSCQGHCLRSRRYVGIAFADHESREAFCRPVEQAGLPTVRINRLDHAANQQAEVTDSGTVRLVRQAADPDKATVSFNHAFGRSYADYVFAELIICDQLPQGRPLWLAVRHPATIGPIVWHKLFAWDRLTREVAALIRSDAVPRYRF